MSKDVQSTKWHRDVAENFNRLSRVHEVTDDRRRTDDDIANVNVRNNNNLLYYG